MNALNLHFSYPFVARRSRRRRGAGGGLRDGAGVANTRSSRHEGAARATTSVSAAAVRSMSNAG